MPWTTQANAMAQAEGSIGASSVNLIGTDCLWAVAMATAIGPCLGLRVFSFVVGITAESIQERKALTCHRDGNLRSKLNIVLCLATYVRSDMALAKAGDSFRNASAIRNGKEWLADGPAR